MPTRSLITAKPHSLPCTRSFSGNRLVLRNAPASNPGQASRYPACCHHGAPGARVRRHVNHLQPTKITTASSHMKTHRGHSAGVNIRKTTGKIITGPQPRQAEICWAYFPGTMFSFVVGARLQELSDQRPLNSQYFTRGDFLSLT